MKKIIISAVCILSTQLVLYSKEDGSTQSYNYVIRQTANMVSDGQAQALAQKYGLNILNLTWEDTGRYKGSAVGPNISDMTIQVESRDADTRQYMLTCMPVIRFPSFEDKTADIAPWNFFLLVGNEKGKPLKRTTLEEYITMIRRHLSKPGSWSGNRTSLGAKRDTHVLVSAQACFLPIPKNGTATFNPVIFNYQSYEGDPAVLAIIATREGTSATIIDNKRDAFQSGATWGQRLFFNQNGQRASFTGKRESEFIKGNSGGKGRQPLTVKAGSEKGLNMVLLIQVPLKQKRPMSFPSGAAYDEMDKSEGPAPVMKSRRSDVENAVIGHGKVEGPFTEIDGLAIERDDRYPIRVTVQFYKATSNGVVSEADIKEIAAQIDRVYKNAAYVGSLVTQGNTGRPTEYDGPKFQPPDWWEVFWERHTSNTGLTPEESIRLLRKIHGKNWYPKSEREFQQEVDRIEKDRRLKK